MTVQRKAGPLFPCGTSRREFVWDMGLGCAGLALSTLLGNDGFFTRQLGAAAFDAPAVTPLAQKKLHFQAKAKSVIFLTMNGGPSQVDTFDYKPVLEKYAGKPLPDGKPRVRFH